MRNKVEKLLLISRDSAQEPYDELVRQRQKLLCELSSCRFCLLEMELEHESAMAAGLERAVRDFALMTPDNTRFAGALGTFMSRLPGDEDGQNGGNTTSAAIIARLMNHVRLGYYPTDTGHIEHLVRGIAFPDGAITNLLDPCCGCGLALRQLAIGNNCMTYGVELDESRAAEAQEQLHRVGVGSFFHARVSHEAFHVLFLNPPYLSVLKEGGGNTRSEKLFLVDSLKHLVKGGLLIYIIPYYRLTADIARILCDNFTDLSVYRFMGKEFRQFVFHYFEKLRLCCVCIGKQLGFVENRELTKVVFAFFAGRPNSPVTRKANLFQQVLNLFSTFPLWKRRIPR